MKVEKAYRVAVLADGDYTTWTNDAFMATLTEEEYGDLADGDSKLLRKKYDDSPMFGECLELLEEIDAIARNRGTYDDATLMNQVREIAGRFRGIK